MSGARILVVDDEVQLRRALRRLLEGDGYEVQEAADGAGGLIQVETFRPDVILLDLMLPDASGVDVCAQIRTTSQSPIIVLSVLGDEKTKVRALDQGADDYLTKPFGAEELLARIRAAFRRTSPSQIAQSLIEAGELTIDLEKRRVTLAGEALHLTPTEFSLLRYLVVNAGRVLTHPMILKNVWGLEYSDDSHLLRTFVNQLRLKLRDDPTKPRFIQTDAGVGYRFIAAQE